MYAQIKAETGDSWEYIQDCWDIPRLLSMNKYWRQHPPIQAMIQAYLEIEPPKEPDELASNGQNAGLLDDLAAFRQG